MSKKNIKTRQFTLKLDLDDPTQKKIDLWLSNQRTISNNIKLIIESTINQYGLEDFEKIVRQSFFKKSLQEQIHPIHPIHPIHSSDVIAETPKSSTVQINESIDTVKIDKNNVIDDTINVIDDTIIEKDTSKVNALQNILNMGMESGD